MQLISRKVETDLDQDGSIIIEILVGVLILAVVGMGLMRSTLMSLKTREHSVRSSFAMQVASDTIEDYAAGNPSSLDDTDDLTDVVTRVGVSFNRVVDVTVNSDNSRTIVVTITPVNTKLGGNADLSLTVVPWEKS